MGDRLDEIPPVDYLLLYFTNETEAQASDIINMYYSGKKPTGDYTRNLYYRDLI